jgi:hypothetical protein
MAAICEFALEVVAVGQVLHEKVQTSYLQQQSGHDKL